jgi:hypothetical protein
MKSVFAILLSCLINTVGSAQIPQFEIVFKFIIETKAEVRLLEYEGGRFANPIGETIFRGTKAKRFLELYPALKSNDYFTISSINSLREMLKEGSRAQNGALPTIVRYPKYPLATEMHVQATGLKGSGIDLNLGMYKYKYPEAITFHRNKYAKYIVVRPVNEANYFNIFNHNNKFQLKEISAIFYDKKPRNRNILFPVGKQEFLNILKKADNRTPHVIIAHNEEGKIKLPNGEEVSFEVIDSIAQIRKLKVIYLSCNSAKYTSNIGTHYSLTYYQAIKIANKIDILFSKLNGPSSDGLEDSSINELLNEINNDKELKSKYGLIFAVLSTTGLFGGLIYVKEKMAQDSTANTKDSIRSDLQTIIKH